MINFSKIAQDYLLNFENTAAPVGEVEGDIGCHLYWEGITSIQISWIGPATKTNHYPDFDDAQEIVIEATVTRWEDNPFQPRIEFSRQELIYIYFDSTGKIIDVEWYVDW